MRLEQLGEERLLARWLPPRQGNRDVVSAVGDDCAVVRFTSARDLLLLKTDCVVEHVHFTSDTAAAAVGWKAMARPLSDFAAMSGVPRYALVTLILPARTNVSWTTALYRGLNRCARAYDVEIVGGETSRTLGPICISVSVVGDVEKSRCVLRSGGKIGDALFVTGVLGGSISGHHLRFAPRIDESRWLTENFQIHAMMDLSDGLGADLSRLARASGVGFALNQARIPRRRGCSVQSAISDGEDHELLFAISEGDAERLLSSWRKKWRLRLTCVGRLAPEGKESSLLAGYDHFAKR